MTLIDQLLGQFNKMDAAQQQRLLNFARILTRTPALKGEAGVSIVKAAGFFDKQLLDEMEAVATKTIATGKRWLRSAVAR